MSKSPIRRYFPVMVIVFLGLVASYQIYLQVLNIENMKTMERLSRIAHDRIGAIEKEVQADLTIIESLVAFFNSSEEVTEEEFQMFSTTLFKNHHSIRALEWVPYIRHSERETFERNVKSKGFSNFEIMERSEGQSIRARDREDYYPIRYVVPYEKNKAAFGFDLGSHPDRKNALMQAIKTQDLSATAPIQLVQSDEHHHSFLVFAPIFEQGSYTKPGQHNLSGLVLGVFEAHAIVESSQINFAQKEYLFKIKDVTDPTNPLLLYQSENLDDSSIKNINLYSHSFDVAGRSWHIACIPDESILPKGNHRQANIAGILSILFTFLITFILFSAIHRNIEIEAVVKQRTHELEMANRDLNDFSYIVSHDLKAPLRAIQSLADIIYEDHGKKLGSEGIKRVQALKDRALRLKRLIDGILNYSKLGRRKQKKEPVQVKVLIDEILGSLDLPPHIHVSIPELLPTVECERVRLEQVFQNLISNAINFMDKAEGKIEIGYTKKPEESIFYVADNGPGIDPKYHNKIFEMFYSSETQESESDDRQGIGLATTKKLVEIIGGKIWVEGAPGEGTTFYFSIPSS